MDSLHFREEHLQPQVPSVFQNIRNMKNRGILRDANKTVASIEIFSPGILGQNAVGRKILAMLFSSNTLRFYNEMYTTLSLCPKSLFFFNFKLSAR